MIDREVVVMPAAMPEYPLTFPGCTISMVSLSIPESTSFEAWEALGGKLRQIHSAAKWWIGDWLNFGERRYGELFAQALDCGADPQLWMDYKWVSRSVTTSLRNEVVTWSHHRAVASLPPEEQAEKLAAAVANGWTVRQLREQIHGKQLPEPKMRICKVCGASYFD